MKKTSYLVANYSLKQSIPGINSKILNQSSIFVFNNRDFITKEMNELAFLFIILEGRAKVVTTQENGKRLILQFLNPNDLIGELTIIGVEKTIKDVIAMGEVICLGIPLTLVKDQLLINNEFLLFLSQHVGKKLLVRMAHVKEQQTQELKIRLAKLLLEISVDGIYHEKHTEIAEYLGVSYRHFMHTFKFFKEQRLIEKTALGYAINEKVIREFIINES